MSYTFGKPIALTSDNLWNIHSYYTTCPWASDNSGRLLYAAADLNTNLAKVYIADKSGKVIDSFGEHAVSASFFHTAFWQTWSSDCKAVYYQGGTNKEPLIVKRDLEHKTEQIMQGDMEGAPPIDTPIVSGLMGMLYAAGYGDGVYRPENAPVAFEKRSEHGLFRYDFKTMKKSLALSTEEVLEKHPDRDRLMREDKVTPLTLMCYCVRWSRDGKRLVFGFGNHCVDKRRGEPRLSYMFTAKPDLSDLHMAIDLSRGRRGVHWSWHPDGEHLIGYAYVNGVEELKLCEVDCYGNDEHVIAEHSSGGHSNISPTDYNLLVTDEYDGQFGSGLHASAVFFDLRSGKRVETITVPGATSANPPLGRNPERVCLHPVFDNDGKRLLINSLPSKNARLMQIDVL